MRTVITVSKTDLIIHMRFFHGAHDHGYNQLLLRALYRLVNVLNHPNVHVSVINIEDEDDDESYLANIFNIMVIPSICFNDQVLITMSEVYNTVGDEELQKSVDDQLFEALMAKFKDLSAQLEG